MPERDSSPRFPTFQAGSTAPGPTPFPSAQGLASRGRRPAVSRSQALLKERWCNTGAEQTEQLIVFDKGQCKKRAN